MSRVARRQMLEDGDWLVPKIGDVPWLEKPPLLHWLAAGCLALSSPYSHWAVRVPSMLAGAGVVFLMAWLIGVWMGEAAGLIAGIVQCTSWYLMAYARLAEADMLLALNVVAAVVVFVRLQGIGLPAPSPRPRTLAVVFWR